MEIRVLRGTEIKALLPMADCIDLMRTTMVAVSEGRARIAAQDLASAHYLLEKARAAGVGQTFEL